MNMSGKRVLITGSSSGIGFGIAQEFAKAGAKVMMHGLRKDHEAEEHLASIQKISKSEVFYESADIGKEEECTALVEKTVEKLGGIDILINNAGIQHVANFEDFPKNKWDQVISVNLSSVFHLSQAAIKHMNKNNWGRIVNIASVHGLVASTGKAAYVAAKHGLLGLTKVIALEYAASNITCNAICPGWVLTPLVEKQINDNAKKQGISFEEAKKNLLLEKQPSGEFVKVEDLGQLAIFLSSEAAAQIKGIAMPVDGAWVSR
jgi:3-hydroxybutyrate dehydrogenase